MVELVSLLLRRFELENWKFRWIFFTKFLKILIEIFQARKGSRSRTRECSSCETGASLDEPLIETGSCSPEESIWYGESELATISNDAGHLDNFVFSNIFDNDENTFWHSSWPSRLREKIITIDFQVSIAPKVLVLSKMELNGWSDQHDVRPHPVKFRRF